MLIAAIVATATTTLALDIPPASAWERTAGGAEVSQVYPLRALRLLQGGTVRLRCRVTAQGDVVDCSIAAEEPKEWGFGDAALKLMPFFKMRTIEAAKRSAVGGWFDMPMVFRLTDPPTPIAK